MSTTTEDLFHVVTEGGVAAAHPPQLIHTALFGPATSAERNTVQEDLTPVACVQLKNARFEFDSSFVGPKVAAEMALLAKLHRGNRVAPISVFGHADPVGNDQYNKTLSGRRAQAVYALLTRRTDLWEDLYSNPTGGDDWDVKSLQVMLATLGLYGGSVDGTSGPQTKEAITAFQSGGGLPADGKAGPKTRQQLYLAYMDAICRDDAGQPFVVDAQSGFLAGGNDAGGRGDYQGCGEFNPLLLFSRAEQQEYQAPANHARRDQENTPNRRVMIFLFRPGTLVNLERWPCPRAKDSSGECKKRFWSDADARRSFGEERRFYEKTRDTFACRFYDRLAIDSPCEAGAPVTRQVLVAGRLPSLFTARRSFPKPSSLPMLREIAKRAHEDPNTRILIVGHTDQPEPDDVGYQLSLARAAAVRALLLGDAGFFRERFSTPDPVARWDFEEVQWMLSAAEVNEDPFYVGFVDGHYASVTRRALGAFQLAHFLDPHYYCDEATLKKLIEEYLALVGANRPAESQIEIVGGGCWHVPRDFGKDGRPLEGPFFEGEERPGYRRVEIFMGTEPFRPDPSACAPARHQNCVAYREWCDSVAETLFAQQNFTLTLRVVDENLVPLGGHAVALFQHEGDDEGTHVATLTTTESGVIRLSVPHGLYHINVNVADEEYSAAFIVHQDEVGGLTIELPLKIATNRPNF